MQKSKKIIDPKVSNLLKPQQVAERFNVSIQTVKRLARMGKLPYHRIGSSFRFSPEDVDVYIAGRRMDPVGNHPKLAKG